MAAPNAAPLACSPYIGFWRAGTPQHLDADPCVLQVQSAMSQRTCITRSTTVSAIGTRTTIVTDRSVRRKTIRVHARPNTAPAAALPAASPLGEEDFWACGLSSRNGMFNNTESITKVTEDMNIRREDAEYLNGRKRSSFVDRSIRAKRVTAVRSVMWPTGVLALGPVNDDDDDDSDDEGGRDVVVHDDMGIGNDPAVVNLGADDEAELFLLSGPSHREVLGDVDGYRALRL